MLVPFGTEPITTMVTRRDFLEIAVAGTTAALSAQTTPDVPWYRRAMRWGQTNITERDPVRYDIPWWREYWKRTAVQGVIINAGGIVAYYPTIPGPSRGTQISGSPPGLFRFRRYCQSPRSDCRS